MNNIETLLLDTIIGVWKDFISHLPFLICGVIILCTTWLLTSLLEKLFLRIISQWNMRRSLKDLLLRLFSIGIWILGLILAAMVVFPGVTPSNALGGLGLASIAIGFAFKEVVENFFAGILLLWRFPMESGDYIECEGISGRIEDITVRMTTIRKLSGELIVVPNSFLFRNPLTIMTSIPMVRVEVVVGIAYSEKIEPAIKLIEEILSQSESVLKNESFFVLPSNFGDSSINIEVLWWTLPDPINIRRSRAEIIRAIKNTFDQHEIEIPYPYRTLTFKEPLKN